MNPIEAYNKKIQILAARARAFAKFGLAASPDYFTRTGRMGADGKEMTLDAVMSMALNQSDESKKEIMRLLDGMRTPRPNEESRVALQELRREDIELFVRARSNFGLFFEPITLKDNEQMVYVHTYKNPCNVKYIAQDGHVGTQKSVKAQKQLFVDMRQIEAEVGYQIRDINLGTDIAAAANATVDVAFEVDNKIDYEAYKLLINGGIFAPFVAGKNGSNIALNATYIPHWRINTANLPTTNDLPLDGTNPQVAKLGLVANGTGQGQSNLFRFACIQAVIDYCESFGEIFNGKLEPTGAIIVPSSDVSGMTASITPTTLFFNEIAEGVLKDYRAFEYLKKEWVMIPDVTLPPGCCYFVMNRPVGNKITKPSMDWEDVDTDRKKNWETRTVNKTLQYFIPEPSRVNILRVRYSSTYQDPTLQ